MGVMKLSAINEEVPDLHTVGCAEELGHIASLTSGYRTCNRFRFIARLVQELGKSREQAAKANVKAAKALPANDP